MKTLFELRKKFITFEGGEGTGKSTQSKLLVNYLNENGVETVWTREPGGCDDAEEIRKLLISGGADRWDGVTELLLMYSARRVHTEKKIKPLLEQGITVVSDRYLDSTLAYQGFGSNIPLREIELVRRLVLGDFKPDLTIILDLDVNIGLARANARGEENRFEDKEIEFHRRVRNGFNYVCEMEKERCMKIDVEKKDRETLLEEIVNNLLLHAQKEVL
jgi:dTMP kinase